jgi:hypothetical protein
MNGPKSRPPRWVEKLYEIDEPLFEPVLAAGVLVETRPLTGT